MATEKKPKSAADTEAHEKLIEAALKEAKLSATASANQREQEIADLEFEAGAHWTPAELETRRQDGRPAEVIDQLSGPILQVTNQPVPGIVVSAVGDGADPKIAEYWQGALRRIEDLSQGEIAYKWARWHTARMGRGFWRIRHDYTNWRSRSMDLRIEAIDNQHTVYTDPRNWRHKTNGRFGIIAEYLTWDEFEAQYGEKAEKVDVSSFRGAGDLAPDWCDKEKVRVAERYYIVDTEVQLCRLADGRTVEHKEGQQAYEQGQIAEEWTATRPRVKWMKFTAAEVLDQADVPGEFIPIIQISGQRRNINGKIDERGIVRMARGPQRMVNFHEMALIENVNHASYTTWLAEETQIEGHEHDWAAPHLTKPAVLLYRKVDNAGHPLPPPQRVSVEPAIQATAIAAERAQNHVRMVTGVPDVFSQEQTQEQSGRAIRERRDQQQLTTNNYNDGLAEGVALTGKVLLSMAREVYDVPRVLRITGLDEKPAMVVAYAGEDRKPEAQSLLQQTLQGLNKQEAAGLKGMFDVTVGDFDISVKAGRASGTGRMETVETLRDLIPVMPPPFQMKAIPVLVKHLDSPGMQELAAALEPDPNSGMVPVEEAKKAQQMIDALSQQLHAVTDQLHDKQADLQSKEKIALADIESKQLIVATQEHTKVLVAEATIQKELALAQLQQQAAQLAAREGQAHEAGMAAAGAGQAQQQQLTQAQIDSQAMDQGHQQAIEQGEQGHAQNLEAQEQAAALAPQPEAGA